MKSKIMLCVALLLMCVMSGIVGAYSVMVLQEHRGLRTTLQPRGYGEAVVYAQERKADGESLKSRRLELTDARGNVRAIFAVEDDGGVYLRMLSNKSEPVVELGVTENSGQYKKYVPSGSLIIRDGAMTPVIQLSTTNEGEGALLFSSARTFGQVSLGYSRVGDAIDEHDRGIWGLRVMGADHKVTGFGAYSEDGTIKGFTVPLESPAVAPLPPSRN